MPANIVENPSLATVRKRRFDQRQKDKIESLLSAVEAQKKVIDRQKMEIEQLKKDLGYLKSKWLVRWFT